MRPLLLSLLSLLSLAAPASAALLPVDLRCDGQANPLAVPAPPQLSWRLESKDRGQSQSAYQILVASSSDLLANVVSVQSDCPHRERFAPDATAIVELPAREGDLLTEGGRPLEGIPGIERLPPHSGVHRITRG